MCPSVQDSAYCIRLYNLCYVHLYYLLYVNYFLLDSCYGCSLGSSGDVGGSLRVRLCSDFRKNRDRRSYLFQNFNALFIFSVFRTILGPFWQNPLRNIQATLGIDLEGTFAEVEEIWHIFDLRHQLFVF